MPEAGLYRTGRWSDVDKYPPAAARISRASEMLDGYRWEDALGEFATVKCSATAEAAIGRTLARYRRRVIGPEGHGIIDAILTFLSHAPDDENEPELVDGRVPDDVFDDLHLIHIPGDLGVVFVDLEHPSTYETLQTELGNTLEALGVGPLGDNLAREGDRRITRLAMRSLYSLCSDGRRGPVAGLRLPGQPDPEWEAFVIWCPPDLVSLTSEDVEFRWIAQWDQDTIAAAKRLGLDLPD
jgi:hypothetical protein